MPHRKYHHGDPRRYLVWTREGLGRRGASLLLFGLIWILLGVQTIALPDPAGYLLLQGPFSWIMAFGYIITGLLAIRYCKAPQGDDIAGFLWLYLMPALRILAYGTAFVIWLWPGGAEGNPRGALGVTSSAVVMIFIILVAGWAEPIKDGERK